MANDKEIIQAMRQDVEKGFRLLMASYKEPVYWHIRRLVVCHADAQDAAQETFVRVFRNFQQYNEANSFKAWIFHIATNETLRLLGRQKGDMMLSLDDVIADMLGTKTDEYFDSSDAITMKLQQAILHLPAKQQLAFNLRYYDEMSYEEIAESGRLNGSQHEGKLQHRQRENYRIHESTPKSPYVKNAFHFVTFTNDSAINTAVGIDILLNICTDFKQSESTT